MWQDNLYVAKAFGFDKKTSLRKWLWLYTQGLWSIDAPKPSVPKLAY
jgi:hypothetical protein